MALFTLRRRQAPRGRYTPDLWSVWLVAPLVLVLVGVLSVGLYYGVYELLAGAADQQNPRKPVDVNDVVKTTVTVLTLIGAVLAGIYAYRKQLLAEGDAHRSDASQLADRYTTAAEQLGHERAAVRLAGVYALARLADDWEEQRQVCIDVLCAYLRMPYEPGAGAPGHREGEREVRLTIIRVIREHLWEPDTPTSWCKYSFDFTGATFDGGDFSHVHFQGVISFEGAVFKVGTVSFHGTRFEGSVSYRNAEFGGGTVTFREASLTDNAIVTFEGARFEDGTVSFERASFVSCHVIFARATFGGGTVRFTKAWFSGGSVMFEHASFDGRAIAKSW
ncbi:MULTISPECIES: pentapeptide repeat-containing protein [unclassified Streptomyces]|uniref:pentapeptide repeat-containing protein n=1 Tax=unclassified Streptomyces TaxID=2593676 RepID=UPI0036E29B4D